MTEIQLPSSSAGFAEMTKLITTAAIDAER
jgi:hypothetical protein